MESQLSFFISVWIKFFFIFTPFFALTMFLTMTHGYSNASRRRLVPQILAAVTILCFGLFFFGREIFTIFGITLDAFRVGAGALLFLSAVSLVQSKTVPHDSGEESEIAVVPLAMPIIVGPATIGTLMVFGAEITDAPRKLIGCGALLTAIICVGAILLLGSRIERILGKKGINILTKITGLILAALAAQMILTGIYHFLEYSSKQNL